LELDEKIRRFGFFCLSCEVRLFLAPDQRQTFSQSMVISVVLLAF